MKSSDFAGIGAKVFTVLAWVSLGVQLIVGLIVLVMGGPPVPIGGADIPARLIGILNVIAAAIYWFLFMFIASVTRLLVDLHRQSVKGNP
jgi:hypothetical protein